MKKKTNLLVLKQREDLDEFLCSGSQLLDTGKLLRSRVNLMLNGLGRKLIVAAQCGSSTRRINYKLNLCSEERYNFADIIISFRNAN